MSLDKKDGMRQITRREAKAANLPRTTYLKVDPSTGMVTFWEETATGKIIPMALGLEQAIAARDRLNELSGPKPARK